ncbi:UvrD-helicase domain-containing protein [Gordonia rubripertincta]|uniref:UvrD-helicase domain-containing protein n=1 Tax=Gordonia rubripertincta TaxID=36822 RepID=UPI0030FE23A9
MNTATLAVAGSRKTQSIVDACKDGPTDRRRLVLTYTLTGQRDLERRLNAACDPQRIPEICGWYAFLLRQWVRPFLPLLYPGRRLAGLNFEGSPASNRRGIVVASGEERFLDSDSRAYKRFLSKLAVDVAEKAEGTVIDRLQRMYDEIYVDEVQDMTGYDLDILEQLLKSTSTIFLVGDIRQSVFDTNPQDPRHKIYRGLKMLDWFNAQHEHGRLDINYSSDTWRCVQDVATFADSIFDASFGFPPTISKQVRSSGHDGVFVIAPEHVDAYVEAYRPVAVLRQTVATVIPEGYEATNFGVSKGLTHERVLIFPTGPIKTFLTKGTMLAPQICMRTVRWSYTRNLQRDVCHGRTG